MTADLHMLQGLLMEIEELGAEAEDKGINRISGLDPLLQKAHSLGVDVPEPTLDDLRTAVEQACEDSKGAAEAGPSTFQAFRSPGPGSPPSFSGTAPGRVGDVG